MTNLEKRIKLEDVLGNKYYNYNLTSSNYNPSLNGSITITCIVTNTLGDAVSGKSLQLFKNGVSLGASYNKTTNSNGVATWSIVCTDAGLQTYSIDIEEIEILVDNKADINHSHSYNDLTNKPTIPTKTSDLDNDSNFLTSHQSLNNYVTTDDSRLSDARTPTSHNHTTGEVTDTSAYSNIGSNANATQKTINNNINTVLGNKANSNNVYSKSETYTQSEITTAISNAVSELTLFEVVSTLPTTNIKNNRLYLIANNENINDNLYDVYLYVNNNWELLDKLEFDISNYYTKSETDTLLGGKVNTSDSRLTDSRTPKSHSHGDITNTGTIGSTANKPLITGSNGKITTGSFGTTANTFVEGNDSRLSDARTPTSHTHSSSEITDLSIPNINGKEDSSNKVNSWSVTTTDEHYPSEKLVKNSLDNKVDKENGKGLFSGSYNDLSDKPTIPTKTSDLNNDSNFITSHQDISGKEDISNKSSNIVTDTGSTTKYPTVKAVEDYAEPKQEAGTFTELISLINNTPTGKTLVLEKDYKNSEGLTGSTTFNNEIHIDGNGHILDFDYKNYYFQFSGEKSSIENWIVEHFRYTTFAIVSTNIIIDNCIFRNSNSNLQTVNNLIVTSNATNFLMGNCQFYNIQASSLRLINLHGSKQYIKNCIFYNNYCNNVIFSNGGSKLVNNTVSCVFKNNRVYDGVIKHNASDNINTIVDCIFNNNTALSGNGIAINCKQNTVLINNKFITSNDTVYPTTIINKNYITEHQDISGKANISDLGSLAYEDDIDLSTHDVSELTDTNDTPFTPKSHTHGISDVSNLQTSLNAKQETLVSGTNIKTINSQSLLGTGDITVGEDVGSFTDLQALIDNASSGDIIILDKDYQYDNNSSYLSINKSLTIHGNGHIIDGNSMVPILVLNGSNIKVTINETTFINGRASGSVAGGAISGSSLSGDSILSLNHCIFIKNQNITTLGGALFIKTGVINHCIFIENTSKRNGGAICCNDNSSVIKNCIFKDNIAQNSNGNDISCNRDTLIIYNCDTSSTNLYNTTNKPYLTDHQDISGKANISDLATVATSGSYGDLSNKPTLSSLSTSSGELSISDVNGLSNALSNSINIEIITDFSIVDMYPSKNIPDSAGEEFLSFCTNSSVHNRTLNENTIYLVPDADGTTNPINYYYEFLVFKISNTLYSELIGTTQIDLSNYIQKTSNNTNLLLANGTNIAQSTFLTSQNVSNVATSGSYADLTNKPSFTQDSNITSSTTGRYAIGTININGSDVTLYGKDTNTVYEHPNYSQNLGNGKALGLYKVLISPEGHIMDAMSVEASDLPSHTHTASDISDLLDELNNIVEDLIDEGE